MANTKDRSAADWLDRLSHHRQRTITVLYTLSGLFALVGAVLWFQSRWEMVPEVLSSLFLALVFGGSGFWYRRHEERQMSDREALRLLVLVVGGLVGFIIALYGIRLAIKWWATV